MASSGESKGPYHSAILASKELFAGSIGGACQVLTGQPFDTIKVRMQTQTPTNTYSGLADCITRLLKNEGPLALYKGTLAPLLGVGACVSVQFGAFESAKRTFQKINESNGLKSPKDLSGAQVFASGSFCGLASAFLACPIEHIRTRLQIQTGTAASIGSNTANLYKGPLDFTLRTLRAHGVSGVFKGQGVTSLREIVGLGIYFYIYEELIRRTMITNNMSSRTQVEPWKQGLYGALAGQAYWVILYPIDVLKSRIQTDNLDRAKRTYSSLLNCFNKSIKAQGVASLYKGFWVCFMRAAPVNAVSFVAYEATTKLIGARD